MITFIRHHLTSGTLTRTQQLVILAALVLSVILALALVWAFQRYNRRKVWRGAP